MNTLNNLSSAVLSSPTYNAWNFWFAGLVDGDGCFYINLNEGSVSLEITTRSLDAHTLQIIKNELGGGTVKLRSGSKSTRFRVKKKSVILDVINRLNGKLYHPVRVRQFKTACELFGVEYIEPPPLISKNCAYFTGLAEADGSFAISVSNSSAADSQISGVEGRIVRLTNAKNFSQISFKITSSYSEYMDLATSTFNVGAVYCEKGNNKVKSKNPKYHWTIQSYADFQVLYQYFRKHPFKGVKRHRMRLSLMYFKYKSLGYHLSTTGSVGNKLWAKFAKSWFKYSF